MTISEIGLSYLSNSIGHQFSYFRQLHDPSLLYHLGQWESLESHYNGMHGSEEWKKCVLEMANYFHFQWIAHYDFRLDSLKSGGGDDLEIHRFLMKTDARAEFDKQARAISAEATGGQGNVVSGWKFDSKEDHEEYAVISVVGDAQKRPSLSERHDGLEQFADSANRHLVRKFI